MYFYYKVFGTLKNLNFPPPFLWQQTTLWHKFITYMFCKNGVISYAGWLPPGWDEVKAKWENPSTFMNDFDVPDWASSPWSWRPRRSLARWKRCVRRAQCRRQRALCHLLLLFSFHIRRTPLWGRRRCRPTGWHFLADSGIHNSLLEQCYVFSLLRMRKAVHTWMSMWAKRFSHM